MTGSDRRVRIPAPPDAAARRAQALRRAWPPLAHGLALLLSLVSAVAVLALGLGLRPASSFAGQPMNPADADLVARFYAGLNQALADGDHAALDAVLASDAAIQLPGQPAGDRAALLAWLADLRHAAPGTRFTLSDVIVGRDRAAAWATASSGAVRIAGAPLLGVATDWDASAFLQFRHGQVVAYAPIAAPAPLETALPPFPLPLTATPGQQMLARLLLPEGRSQAALRLLHWQLLLDEAGMAEVAVAGPVQWVIAGPDSGRWQEVPRTKHPVVLRPGTALLIPPDVPLAIHPAGDGAAALLLLGDEPLTPEAARRSQTTQSAANQFATGTGLLQFAEGATIEPLAESMLPTGQGAGANGVVAVTQAALPPGAALAPHPVAGLQLVAVEAGLLRVAAPALAADGADPTGKALIQDGYPPGRGTAPRLRNAGGTRLDLVIVTVDPLSPTDAASTASPVASAGAWLSHWTASRVATATAARQVCLASACH